MICELTIETRDKYGQLKYFKKQEANSFLLAFIDLISCQWDNSATFSTPLMSNGSSAGATSVWLSIGTGASGADDSGIIVGTGTNAVTLTDNKLQTIILNGTTSGLLQYGSMAMTSPATVGTSRQFTISRTFTNSTGAGITVNEVGIAVKNGTDVYWLIDRTLSTFTINSLASSTVTYTIKATV